MQATCSTPSDTQAPTIRYLFGSIYTGGHLVEADQLQPEWMIDEKGIGTFDLGSLDAPDALPLKGVKVATWIRAKDHITRYAAQGVMMREQLGLDRRRAEPAQGATGEAA